MKLLHLSDLHLGKRVNEFSMIDDQRHVLDQILCVIDAERPDAVLIAGDVYDKPVPTAEAVALLDWFLGRAVGAGAASLCHQRQPRFRRTHGLRRAADGAKRRPSGPGVRRNRGPVDPHR